MTFGATLPLNAWRPVRWRCLSVCGHDAEVVALGIPHPGVALEALAHGGTESRQPIDLGEPLGRCEVQMERRLRSRLEVDLLETELDMRAVDDDTRIRLGRVAERRQPGNLFVVVRPDLEAVQRRRPDPARADGVAQSITICFKRPIDRCWRGCVDRSK